MKITRRKLRRLILQEARRITESAQASEEGIEQILLAAVEAYFVAKETAGPMWSMLEGTAVTGLEGAIKSGLKGLKIPDPVIDMAIEMIKGAMNDKEKAQEAAKLLAGILAAGMEDMQSEEGRQKIMDQIQEKMGK